MIDELIKYRYEFKRIQKTQKNTQKNNEVIIQNE